MGSPRVGRWLTVLLVAFCWGACASDCSHGDDVRDTGANADGAALDLQTDGLAYPDAADQKVALDQQGPDKPAPDTAALDQQTALDQKAAPDTAGADQALPDQALLDQQAPDQLLPDQKPTPDVHHPDQKVTPASDLGPGTVPGTWVVIKAGAFKMGSPLSEKCRYKTEPVQLPVTLTRSYLMQTTEVTQAQHKLVRKYNPSSFSACGGACPVEMVSWHEAAAYCNALSALAKVTPCYACTGSAKSVACAEVPAHAGKAIYACKGYRLPTEAEWEYAYRAGTQTALYNGAITSCLGACVNADKIGWYQQNGGQKTHPAAQKAKNAWGLYDMAGNVEEWTQDRYAANLGASAQVDPVVTVGTERSLRSGSWKGFANLMRGAVRYGQPPTARAHNIGFRCVRSLP